MLFMASRTSRITRITRITMLRHTDSDMIEGIVRRPTYSSK